MIGQLTGTIAAVGDEAAILDVGGVGYLVLCGSRTLGRLAKGETTTLHVETLVREDSIRLFGFLSEDERAWFVRLQDIQGVGAKVALSLLDALTPGQLMNAAAMEDKAALDRAQGVGARLAARIVAELKDKPPPATRLGGPARAAAPPRLVVSNGKAGPAEEGEDGALADAASALINLGVQDAQARMAVAAARDTFDAPPKLDALVKAALKELGR